MRTFHEILADTRNYTDENLALSWWHLLSTLLVMGLLLYGTLLPIPFVLRLASSLVLGLVVVRMFIIYHDYQHGAIFRDSLLVKPIMAVFGVVVLNPPNVWNRSHNFHHSKNSQIATASIGSFPIMTVQQYKNSPFWTKVGYRFARSPFVFLSGHLIIFVVGMCLKSFVTDPKRHFDSLLALLLHAAIIVWLASVSLEILFLAYLIPLYFSCMLGAYLFYIQHNFPTMKLRPREKWEYGFAALNSSSFMEGSWLTHWLTGNIGYHHIHHTNSRIPFYRLPEVMASIPELQNPGRTSLKPTDIYRCMKLKVWDPQQEKMVGFEAISAERVSAPLSESGSAVSK